MSMSIDTSAVSQLTQTTPAGKGPESTEISEHDGDSDDRSSVTKAQPVHAESQTQEAHETKGAPDEAGGSVGQNINTHA